MKKIVPYLIIVSVILIIQFSLSFFEKGTYQAYAFHTDKEITEFNNLRKFFGSKHDDNTSCLSSLYIIIIFNDYAH